jgi:hypothetical protein
MQEGMLSLHTYLPQLWHLTRISSEKISTSLPQLGHALTVAFISLPS